MTTYLTRNQSGYLADNMVKVSRSFAIVATEVESPMDDYLAVAYLICRVLDNIEDAEQPFAWKLERFTEFRKLLGRPETAVATLESWQNEAWPGISPDEEQMMGVAGGYPLWQILAEMPAPYREPVTFWADKMAEGMCCTVSPSPNGYFGDHDGVRLPLTLEDYNLYCYYVAGTVGCMITEMMVRFYGIDEETAAALRESSQTCGRGLQKTNIVKDFAVDLQRGFSFLPLEWLSAADYAPLRLQGAAVAWKRAVLQDVLTELDNSVDYVTGLPRRALGFRKAGLLMLLPAYETLLLAAEQMPRLFTARHEVKISRAKMMQVISKTQRVADDDAAILALTGEMAGRVSAAMDRHG